MQKFKNGGNSSKIKVFFTVFCKKKVKNKNFYLVEVQDMVKDVWNML